ncbi:MAG: hypothetical protein ACR2O0_09260 [Rhizobiaceae bacterium]
MSSKDKSLWAYWTGDHIHCGYFASPVSGLHAVDIRVHADAFVDFRCVRGAVTNHKAIDRHEVPAILRDWRMDNGLL